MGCDQISKFVHEFQDHVVSGRLEDVVEGGSVGAGVEGVEVVQEGGDAHLQPVLPAPHPRQQSLVHIVPRMLAKVASVVVVVVVVLASL